MRYYDLELAPGVVAAARRDGFDPKAVIVPSAVGVPFSTGLAPAAFDTYVKSVLDLAVGDMNFVDFGAEDDKGIAS